jgi:ABC-type nitrate/sulfonate/bicarbonate transport system substrate-binding protein
MTEVQLGFKAYDVHELLCHAVASTAGYYAQESLSVKLMDTTFLPDEALPENTLHVACGAAMASFLAGAKRHVVFVACDRPMFWLYSRAGIEGLEQLGEGRIATFPDAAPPSKFLQKLLLAEGIAPGLLPCRDDVARLGLLRSGSVDGALLSSHFLPAEVERSGVHQLAFLGDALRLPSTGLAVSGTLYEQQPDLVATMVKVYQRAMKAIFDDDQQLLRTALLECFGKTEESLDQVVEVVRACYNPFGYSYDSILQPAIDGMAAGMGLATRDCGELYKFQYIKSYN